MLSYSFDRPSVDLIRRRVQEIPGSGAGSVGPARAHVRTAVLPPTRTAKVYGGISAGGDQPGIGEAILDKIDRESRTYVSPRDEPVTVYNTSPVTFLDGARIQVHWDQTILRRVNGVDVVEAGWLVSDRIGGGDNNANVKRIIAQAGWRGLPTPPAHLRLDYFEGDVAPALSPAFEIVPYQDDPPLYDGIKVLQSGLYLVGYTATVRTVSSAPENLILDVDIPSTGAAGQPSVGTTSNGCLKILKGTGWFGLTVNADAAGAGGDERLETSRMDFGTFSLCGVKFPAPVTYAEPEELLQNDIVRLKWNKDVTLSSMEAYVTVFLVRF